MHDLNSTINFVILIPLFPIKKCLESYTDSDWSRDETSRRSRTGNFILFNEAPILWTSKLPTATETSTAEAEFPSLLTSAKEKYGFDTYYLIFR